MVRSITRSRGCSICRRRRIKCDEALPECTQCRKNGKKCPGPITGTFYIIASETCTSPSSSPTELRQITRISASGCPYPFLKSGTSNEASRNVVQYAPARTDIPIARIFDTLAPTESSNDIFLPTMPSYYQPSRAEAFEQLFFSYFFEAFGKGVETIGACSWLSKLPARMATTYSSLTMRYSSCATSIAFYGILNGEVSIQTESRKSYARALETRRADLCRDAMQQFVKTPASEEAICGTVMMCYFELLVKTTPVAWIQHLDAAAAMLETIGPEECQPAFIHQLFRTVRVGVGYASVLRKTPHIFAQEYWKTIPFEKPKKQLDNLVDIILSIPEYISLAERMINLASTFNFQESAQRLRGGLSVLIFNLEKF